MTHKRCFNRKYRQLPAHSNALLHIAELSKIPLIRLRNIYNTKYKQTLSCGLAFDSVYFYALSH